MKQAAFFSFLLALASQVSSQMVFRTILNLFYIMLKYATPFYSLSCSMYKSTKTFRRMQPSNTKTGRGGRVVYVIMFQILVETDAKVPGLNPTQGKCLYGTIMDPLNNLVYFPRGSFSTRVSFRGCLEAARKNGRGYPKPPSLNRKGQFFFCQIQRPLKNVL